MACITADSKSAPRTALHLRKVEHRQALLGSWFCISTTDSSALAKLSLQLILPILPLGSILTACVKYCPPSVHKERKLSHSYIHTIKLCLQASVVNSSPHTWLYLFQQWKNFWEKKAVWYVIFIRLTCIYTTSKCGEFQPSGLEEGTLLKLILNQLIGTMHNSFWITTDSSSRMQSRTQNQHHGQLRNKT